MKTLWYRSVAVLLVLLLCSLMPAALAAEDGMYEYEVRDGNAVIVRYLGSGNPTVTLPVSLGGYPVTGIEENAFGKLDGENKPHSEITAVNIPAGITYIGDRALAGTAWFDSAAAGDKDGFVIVNGMLINYVGNKKNVTVPNTVKIVNYGAFEKNEIVNVTLPASVTEIRDYAFYKCTALETIAINGEITSIGKSAFNDCGKLTELHGDSISVLPDSLETIGDNAFYNCVSLSGTVDLGQGLIAIGANAFANCASLDGIRVPDTLEMVGAYALGFSLVRKDNAYTPAQKADFVIYVSHEENEDAAAEQEILKTYSKTSKRIYNYARNPDGNGYFAAFRLVWDRLAYPFKMGDVNNDGKVNSTDARVALRHSAHLEMIEHEDDLRAGDVNGDSRVNSQDARLLLRAAAGLEKLPD